MTTTTLPHHYIGASRPPGHVTYYCYTCEHSLVEQEFEQLVTVHGQPYVARSCKRCRSLKKRRDYADRRRNGKNATPLARQRFRCTSCGYTFRGSEFDKRRLHRRHHSPLKCPTCVQRWRGRVTTCDTCEKLLPLEEFPGRRLRDKRPGTTICRTCKPTSKLPRRVRKPGKLYHCTTCQQILPASEYTPLRHNRSILRGSCKACRKRHLDSRERTQPRNTRTDWVPIADDYASERANILRDYEFARETMGYGHWKAIEWLQRGYKWSQDGLDKTCTRQHH